MEVTPFNVEYYYVSQSINEMLDKHLAGDWDILSSLTALDLRLKQMYTEETPKDKRLFFLHYLLMLWGGQIFPRQIKYEDWYAAAEKFLGFKYGGE